MYPLQHLEGRSSQISGTMSSPDNKTVVIITPFFFPNIGGVETRFLDICQWLSKNGYQVKVLTYQPITSRGIRAPAREKTGSLEVFRLDWPGGDLFHKLQKLPFLQTAYISSGLLVKSFLYLCQHRKEIDIVHAAGFNAAFISRISCGLLGIKWVMSTHAIYDFQPGSFLSRAVRWILNGAEKIIAISEVSKEELIAIAILPEKIITHITWVDQNLFKPLDQKACRKNLGMEDNFVVFFAGRLREIKGVLLLLEVARVMPDITFVLAGDGPLAPTVKKAAAELANLQYEGPIPNKDLPVYYNAADITIMPSIYKEPFGRVVLESLSCGTACICSDLGAIARHLDSSVVCLVNPTVENIRGGILDLRKNREKLREMSSRCRPFAESAFSEKNMDTLLQGYGFI